MNQIPCWIWTCKQVVFERLVYKRTEREREREEKKKRIRDIFLAYRTSHKGEVLSSSSSSVWSYQYKSTISDFDFEWKDEATAWG